MPDDRTIRREPTRQFRTTYAALALAVAPFAARAAPPSESRTLPRYLDGVGLDEKIGAEIPRDLAFVDDEARPVRLGDFVGHGRPVLLTFNYSHCPMLCSLQLDGLVRALRGITLEPGRDFALVTVSLDPHESPTDARRVRDRYVRRYGRPELATAWHFLTGTETNVRTLAETVGFRYRHDPNTGDYYHPAALPLLTSDARVSRYVYGIEAPPETLRLALIEASRGQLGSIVDRLMLYCCAYDPARGRYALSAGRIVRFGALATAALLLVTLGRLWATELLWLKRGGRASNAELTDETGSVPIRRTGHRRAREPGRR